MLGRERSLIKEPDWSVNSAQCCMESTRPSNGPNRALYCKQHAHLDSWRPRGVTRDSCCRQVNIDKERKLCVWKMCLNKKTSKRNKYHTSHCKFFLYTSKVEKPAYLVNSHYTVDVQSLHWIYISVLYVVVFLLTYSWNQYFILYS